MRLRIKQVIKLRGYTIESVAKRMGISRTALYYHINGNPSVEVLQRIADALGVRVIDLFENPNTIVNGVIIYKNKAYNVDGFSSLKELYAVVELERGAENKKEHFLAMVMKNGILYKINNLEELISLMDDLNNNKENNDNIKII